MSEPDAMPLGEPVNQETQEPNKKAPPIEEATPATGEKKEPEAVGGYDSKHEVAPDPIGGYNEDGTTAKVEKAPVKVDPENPSLNEIDNLDEDRRSALQEFITKSKLSKAQVKELIGLEKSDMARRQELFEAGERQAQKEMDEQRRAFADELKRDQKYGGPKFKETLAKVQKLEDMGVTSRIMKLAKDQNLVVHPEIMRDLADIHDKLTAVQAHNFGQGVPENISLEEKEIYEHYGYKVG